MILRNHSSHRYEDPDGGAIVNNHGNSTSGYVVPNIGGPMVGGQQTALPPVEEEGIYEPTSPGVAGPPQASSRIRDRISRLEDGSNNNDVERYQPRPAREEARLIRIESIKSYVSVQP